MSKIVASELEELAETLRDTLRVIAFAGHSTEKQYITERQEFLRAKWGARLFDENLYILQVTNSNAEHAYAQFMHLLDGNPGPQEIQERSEEILRDCLNVEDVTTAWISDELGIIVLNQ